MTTLVETMFQQWLVAQAIGKSVQIEDTALLSEKVKKRLTEKTNRHIADLLLDALSRHCARNGLEPESVRIFEDVMGADSTLVRVNIDTIYRPHLLGFCQSLQGDVVRRDTILDKPWWKLAWWRLRHKDR